MAFANVIDSFFVALGFKTDAKGLEAFEKKAYSVKDSIMSIGSAITAVGSALALKKIGDIGSAFEQNRIQIAGFLNALGLSTGWDAALGDASTVIKSITADAAKLPGEAEEYIEVFKAGLPFIKEAMPGASLGEMTKFSNTITAIGKTLGVDAGQIGRDLTLLLSGQGRAGVQVKLFQQMLPFIRQLKEHANITAASFNAMSQPERLKLLQDSFASLQPMLDASASSFDAMMGAIKSSATQLIRLSTAGIFNALKEGLEELNALFFDSQGNLTEFGKKIVETTSAVFRWGLQVIKMVLGVTAGIARLTVVSWGLKAVVAVLIPLLAGLALNSMTTKVLGVVGALGKLRLAVMANTMLIGGLALAIGLIAEDLYQFYNGGESVTGMLVDEWAPALGVIIGLLSVLTLALSPPLFAIGLLAAGVYLLHQNWQEVLEFVEGGLNGWVKVLNKVVDAMNVVNRLIGGKDAKLNAHFEGFSFATERRENANAQDVLGAGNGVLLPEAGPAQPFSGMGVFAGNMGWGGGGNSSVVNSETNVGQVVFKTDNPREMKREWDKHVRDGQSAVDH